MSNWRKGRYGWTKEAWLVYKRQAMFWVRMMECAHKNNAAIAEMMDRED